MRLSQLRPCDQCRGPVLPPGSRVFYLVGVIPAMVDPIVAGAVLGQAVGAVSLDLAETMVPNPEAVRLVPETKLFLCSSCYGHSTVEPLARPEEASARLG